ncbi:MAG TPA: hypothetical protein VHO70_08960, partial [Chitinispirillaceae bacterium]|nr:hypothetical protein [Chitinispirillaceae bacterium]
MSFKTGRLILVSGLITAGFQSSFSQIDLDINGDKWSFNQISSDGVSWGDTTEATIYTRDASGKLTSIDNYTNDKSSNPAGWKLLSATVLKYDENNPLLVNGLQMKKNETTGITDTTKIYYVFNSNNTLASMEYKMQMKPSPTVVMDITMKLFQWYNGTEIAGDSSLATQIIRMAGSIYPPGADTTPKRYEKSSYTWSAGSLEKKGYSWDTTSQIWIETDKQVSTLDNEKKPLVEVITMFENGAWVNSKKDSIIYTSAGKIAEEISFEWENNAWKLSDRTVHLTSNLPAFLGVHTMKKIPVALSKRVQLKTDNVQIFAINGCKMAGINNYANKCTIRKSVENKAITRSI